MLEAAGGIEPPNKGFAVPFRPFCIIATKIESV